MYCHKCGSRNDDNAYKCVNCGEILQHGELAPPILPRTSGKAIASMICSIAGFFVFFLVGQIVGLVLGYNAKKEIRASRGRLDGEGFATAGIIIGWVGIAVDLLIIGFILLFILGIISFGLLSGCG